MAVRLRLWLYRHHFLGSTEFDVPVICVGNLSVGGTGKTPMIEYLTGLLQPIYPVGIISRGYGRKTTGFLRVHPRHSAEQAGDEPLLLKLKHPATEVAVGEARVIAIPRLLSEAPQTQVILMDDGFQHLSVRPQVNILLTSYTLPFWKDHLMPMGTLREFPSAKDRANIIVVTKCPANMTTQEREACQKAMHPLPHQKIFFSSLQYGPLYPLWNGPSDLPASGPVIALSGIADASLFLEQISKTYEPVHFDFSDHHPYTLTDLNTIKKNYSDIRHWITTEKDAVRLMPFQHWFTENQVALWVQPVQTVFLPGQPEAFSDLLLRYMAFYYPEPAENEAE